MTQNYKPKEYYSKDVMFTSFKEDLKYNRKYIDYICWGKEICPKTGKQHLQGFVQLTRGDYSRKFIQSIIGDPTCHIARMYSSPRCCTKYCKKDNIIFEYGKVVIKKSKKKLKLVQSIEKITCLINDFNDYKLPTPVQLLNWIEENKDKINDNDDIDKILKLCRKDFYPDYESD